MFERLDTNGIDELFSKKENPLTEALAALAIGEGIAVPKKQAKALRGAVKGIGGCLFNIAMSPDGDKCVAIKIATIDAPDLGKEIYRKIRDAGDITIGLLKNQNRNVNSSFIEKALQSLLDSGDIIAIRGVHKYNKRPYTKYKVA